MRMDHRRTINNTSNATVNPCALLRERINDLKKNVVESDLIPLDQTYAGFRAPVAEPGDDALCGLDADARPIQAGDVWGRPCRKPVPFRMQFAVHR